ncbi:MULTISPECIES: hypothetical protein [Paraburkholderia]|uniref:Uncharacterized protein n=1 Tax=Paraburkholderia madseniana TaxID=2599607 RepID=A0AAP5BCC9_9BURK|nr:MULTISPECIES: hypothetical protein [Paraburkholderia]MCX4146907.1 hypothetical protein [Paraburkholderia madseniana]MDN7149853.1 hypothetical protein [Paraburkholderia sp. WS6]MDQ6408733.1 hypothetical protein [Paraburkholderia madseniana]
MHKTCFIYRPPCPGPLLTGIGVVAGVTAISIAATLCYEQYRKRELVRSLASMPGAADIVPALHANAAMLLAALGRPVRPAFHDKP